MALKEGLNRDEMDKLVATLIEEEGNWEKSKRRFAHVDPKALDKGFKAWAFKKAGLKLPETDKALAAELEKQEKLAAQQKAEARAEAEKAGAPIHDAVDPLK